MSWLMAYNPYAQRLNVNGDPHKLSINIRVGDFFDYNMGEFSVRKYTYQDSNLI